MPIEINLLPWRQIKRRREKRKIITLMLILFSVIILCSFFVKLYLTTLNNLLIQRNQQIKDNIALLNEKINQINQLKIKKNSMDNQILVMQRIKTNNRIIVRLFGEISKITPNGVFLNQMRMEIRKIILQGVSESNDSIRLMIKNIEQNPWMKNPNLLEVKKIKDSRRILFNLSFILKITDK